MSLSLLCSFFCCNAHFHFALHPWKSNNLASWEQLCQICMIMIVTNSHPSFRPGPKLLMTIPTISIFWTQHNFWYQVLIICMSIIGLSTVMSLWNHTWPTKHIGKIRWGWKRSWYKYIEAESRHWRTWLPITRCQWWNAKNIKEIIAKLCPSGSMLLFSFLTQIK